MKLPRIIQGGMGVGVSSYKLANVVSKHGELGVVSGTALAVSFVRRLQNPVGNEAYVEALETFPIDAIKKRIYETYYNTKKEAYKTIEMPTINMSFDLESLIVCATYCEVYLAKRGHKGLVGINLLEKIQTPTLPTLYGAMLAQVDVVLMGAGIPIKIPAILNALSNHQEVSLPIKVQNTDTQYESHFDPKPYELEHIPNLKRPFFFAIVGSHTLAQYLAQSETGKPDGFVIELPIAGGHNAPPRGKYESNSDNEPIYGEKDKVNLEQFQKIGLPYYLAGGYASNEKYKEALSQGASGIQVGTAFAFSVESGFELSLKDRIIKQILKKTIRVKTDAKASPTGFPFKVALVEDTLGDETLYQERKRICDLGYLREAYLKEDGNLGYRCPSEPVEAYLKKGGKVEDTVGRKCLCNGLVSALGLAQIRHNLIEKPLITAGDDLNHIIQFLKSGEFRYSAARVLEVILGKTLVSI